MALGKQASAAELAAASLTCAPKEALGMLRRLGFKDPLPAMQTLDRLAVGPAEALDPLPPELLVACTQGYPDRALGHLERLLDALGSRSGLYRRCVEQAAFATALTDILGHSTFLTEILVRNPEYLYWLLEETPYLSQDLDKGGLRKQVQESLVTTKDMTRRLDALRRIQRRELLRLGAAQILGLKSPQRLGRELADLADIVVEVVLDTARKELIQRFGKPVGPLGRPANFTVVCLGKHGGQELNFYSDIDLVFVYDEDGQTTPRAGAASVSNGEFFNRLGERVVQLLSQTTVEGAFYRVDMRLRPEGEAGSLVRSLRASWLYYETRGEIWERQMLLKARRAAGSTKLWRQLQDMLLPFVFPAHFSTDPAQEIRHTKDKIEAQVHERSQGDNHIKLQPGGIRDIEFIVQFLQLLNGRVNLQARHHNTLEAISRLQKTASLTHPEAITLSHAYLLYRRVENLLQISDGRAVYALPKDAEARRALARLLGFSHTRAFDTCLKRHLKGVRALFERIFQRAPNEPVNLAWILTAPAGGPPTRALEDCGFADGAAAHRHLRNMANSGLMGFTARSHLETVLPELLAALAAAPDPNQGLVHFVNLVEIYGAPGIFFDMLMARPNFRRLVTTLCGSSRFLVDLVLQDPGLLDGLVNPGNNIEPLIAAADKGDMKAVRRYRDQELLRLGVDDLLGLSTSEETFLQLSHVAEEVLHMVYAEAWRRLVRRHGKPRTKQGRDARFACFAGGKFGGRELGFGSDLDLFFIYAGDGKTGRTATANSVFFIELCQELMQLLQGGGLFEMDARLRPEGRNAPMAISFAAYQRYLVQRAATWERLALSRARLVAGDEELGRKVERCIRRYVFSQPINASTAAEVEQMRYRMEPSVRYGSSGQGQLEQVDIKRGPGGMVDIEFIAQILALHKGGKDAALCVGNTRQLLGLLTQKGHLSVTQGRFLGRTYEQYRQLEKGMRIANDQAVNTLVPGQNIPFLERLVGANTERDLVEETKHLMKQTREVFKGVFSCLKEKGV